MTKLTEASSPDPEDKRVRPLGTAQFREPEEVANYHSFEPGDFWLGRCPFSGAPLGHADDRHVLLVSGTREGKGTGVIIPNLCLWEGSAFVIDPKGENATISAARRGDGSEYAEGMGQDVYVLDPFRMATVDAKYRVRFNPLDGLDVSSGTFAADLRDLVVAMMPLAKEEQDSGIWTKLGRRLLMHLIMHVLTCEDFEGRRNLVTVRRLLTLGDYELYKTLEDAGEENVPPPMALLWESMRMNPAFDGAISAAGQDYIDNAKNNPKRNGDIRLNAVEETDFLDVEQFKDLLGSSVFSLSELKTNPKGVTIYLCLPFHRIGSFYPWLRLMVTLGLAASQEDKSAPACGHRTLFCLDEFASLRRMEPVKDAMATIAGYHVTMFLVLQGLGQLEDIYGKGSEEIIENCGLQMHFGVGQSTAKQLSAVLGEVEVIRTTETGGSSEAIGESTTRTTTKGTTTGASRTKGEALTRAQTETINKSLTHTKSASDTRSNTHTKQKGRSRSKSRSSGEGGGTNENFAENWNESEGESRGSSRGSSRNWNKGRSSGSSKGENWANPGHGIFGDVAKWLPWVRDNETVNYQTQDGRSAGHGGGTNKSTNVGTNRSKGRGGSRGGGSNASWNTSTSDSVSDSDSLSDAQGRSVGQSTSDAEGRSEGHSSSTSRTENSSETHQHSTSLSEASAEGRSRTLTTNTGTSQSVHKRPLLTPDEIQIWFGREDEQHRPGEPAWALVLLKGHRPALVHRSPYFRDVGFRWLFDPEPERIVGPKLIGPIDAELPPVHAPEFELLQPSVEWRVDEGQKAEWGEEILTIEVAGPRKVLTEHFIEERKLDIDLTLQELGATGEPHSERLRLPVYAAASGTVAKHELENFELIGNRRHHQEREQEELAEPMAEYLMMLTDLLAQQGVHEAEEREREEAEKARREKAEREEAERRESARHERQSRERRAEAREEYDGLCTRVAEKAKQAWWKANAWCDTAIGYAVGSVPWTLFALFGLKSVLKGEEKGLFMVLGFNFFLLGGAAFLLSFLFVEEFRLHALSFVSEKSRSTLWGLEADQKHYIDRVLRELGHGDVIDELE